MPSEEAAKLEEYFDNFEDLLKEVIADPKLKKLLLDEAKFLRGETRKQVR